MKKIKLKPLIISCMICLLPILLGVAVYNKLPDKMPVHFDFYNRPDHFMSKPFAVFVIPCLITLLQIFCCVINDINAAQKGVNKKFELVIKSMIPAISIIVYSAMIAYSMGTELDMRKIAMFIVGIVFVSVGNYMPTLNDRNQKSNNENVKKRLRLMGYEMVIMGIVFIVTIFLPPAFSIGALVFMIPCTIVNVLIARRKSE